MPVRMMMNKTVMIAAALSLSMTGAANACAPAPSCWISEGTSYLRSVCRNYAKANRTVAEIKEFVDEPEKIGDFVTACKKQGIIFKTGAAAPSKTIKAIVCIGDQAGAHTLVIGNCSFEGEQAKQVVTICKNENDVCRVEAHGWDNGQGMVMITSVESVSKNVR